MNMVLIKYSNSKSLLSSESKVHKESGNLDKKQKKKKNKPHKESELSSKGESYKKERPNCAYFKKDVHEENYFYNKCIDDLKHLLKNNHIELPSRMSKSPFSPSSK